MKLVYILFGVIILCTASTGCKKFVQVDTPYTLLATTAVFNDPSSATAAQVGVYIKLSAYTPYNVARRTGGYADELTNYSTAAFVQAAYTNSLYPSLNIQSWTEFYALVYAANSVIDGLNNSTTLSDALKAQLMGEAKFSRAYFYFYLVNLFGDVPMPLGVNYQQNSLLPRTAQADVYKQIIADLKDAEASLNTNFVDNTSLATSSDRIRPTKWAARAMLARVYLYTGDYANAEAMSSLVIGNTALFSLKTADLNTVFSKNSTEAIWQLENVTNSSVQTQGYNFIITFLNTIGESNSSAISSQLLAAFEPGDLRKTRWLGTYTSGGTTYYYPFKYQQGYNTSPTQNETVLRLAEQYLIRAEARAQQGNTTNAIADLNVIRNRANIGNYTGATDNASVLAAILRERRVELFAEWGHRWFDLKRSGTVNSVMGLITPLKGGTWAAYKQLWPVPLSEINKDPNLTQNPGY